MFYSYTTSIQLTPILVVSLMYLILLWRTCHQNVFQQDGEYSTSQSESEFNYSNVSKENDQFVNSWMPPARLVESKFNVIVTNVDMKCNIYFQILDEETSQSLQLVTDELNDIFSNSQPEPINMKWSEEQSVIVKYHLDNKWYRGTILKISDNEEFTVQFYDYGNIETCKHEDLRSTLYMTEVPQLCHKGFFSSILPITKNGKWPIPTLDMIHSLVVERTCMVTVDASLSTANHCAIKTMKEIDHNLDVLQYLVTEKKAYFEYVSPSILNLVDTDEINNDDADDDSNCYAADDNGYDDCTTYVDGGSIYDDGGLIYNERGQTCDEFESILDNRLTYALDKEPASGVGAISEEEDDDEESGFLKFCLEPKEVIEGTMCRITGPTSLTLVITKIGGVDLSVAKDNMCKVMQEKCNALPPLDRIIPGTAVAVYHHELWQRGVIEDIGNSVLLVDSGISIKLRQNNLRPCLPEFFELPMFTIDCQLENVRLSDNANAKDVVKKLSKTLRGVDLKIVGISESDNDIVGVELYNGREEIAYQSLIDAKLLIPV